MKFAGVFAALAVADAGTVAVTWSDCGAKHATVTDLQPLSVKLGGTQTLTGTGTVDEDVTSAFVTATAYASGVKIVTCSGDGTVDIVCKLPLGAGQIAVKALDFPIAAGTVTLAAELTTSSLLPSSLAKTHTEVRATEQNGEDLICLDLDTQQQTDVDVEFGCSGTDDFDVAPLCYGKTVLGEEVVIKIDSFDSGTGHLSMVGSGEADISCESTFEKDETNALSVDTCDMSQYATVKGMQYCSDSDELKAIFLPLGVSIPVSQKFPRIECPATLAVASNSTTSCVKRGESCTYSSTCCTKGDICIAWEFSKNICSAPSGSDVSV